MREENKGGDEWAGVISTSSSQTKGKGPVSWLYDESRPGGKEGASSATCDSPEVSRLIGAKPLMGAILNGASALAVMPDSKDCISRSDGT